MIWSDNASRAALRRDPHHGEFRPTEAVNVSMPDRVLTVTATDPDPTVSDLDIEIGPKRETGHGHQGLLSETELLVPESCWRIVHYFSELENRPFLNSGIDAPTLNVVRQDTEFRLDRSGVQLKSEATVYTIGLASDYIFDGPFLIVIRDRDSRRPLFVMWVETAELLEPWEGQGADE